MPSRKKAQGKARKAAKAELAAAAARKETDLVTHLNRLHMVEGYENETCTHGYEMDGSGICGDVVKHFLDIVDQVPLDVDSYLMAEIAVGRGVQGLARSGSAARSGRKT